MGCVTVCVGLPAELYPHILFRRFSLTT
jgi:hypothetical protein